MRLRELINDVNFARIRRIVEGAGNDDPFADQIEIALQEFTIIAEEAGIVESDVAPAPTDSMLLQTILKELRDLSNSINDNQAQLDAGLQSIETSVGDLTLKEGALIDLVSGYQAQVSQLLVIVANYKSINANAGNPLTFQSEDQTISDIQAKVTNLNNELETLTANVQTSSGAVTAALSQASSSSSTTSSTETPIQTGDSATSSASTSTTSTDAAPTSSSDTTSSDAISAGGTASSAASTSSTSA